MSMTAAYPRDLIGYGAQVPHAQWPGQASCGAICSELRGGR
jgi:hypothetical protein